jgi:hypothetical protein
MEAMDMGKQVLFWATLVVILARPRICQCLGRVPNLVRGFLAHGKRLVGRSSEHNGCVLRDPRHGQIYFGARNERRVKMRTLSAIAIAAAIATVPIGAWVHAAEQYPQTMTSPHFRERCVAWWAGKHPPVGSFTPADVPSLLPPPRSSRPLSQS